MCSNGFNAIFSCLQAFRTIWGKSNLAVLVLTAMVHRLAVGGKHRNGTSCFYRLATHCVVEKGMRFEIAATEYSTFSNLPKVVMRLLDESSRYVRIGHLPTGMRSSYETNAHKNR